MTFTMMPLVGAGEGYAESGNTANTVVTRTTTLDLTSTNGKYMATNGNEKTVDFTTASVNDSAEGWEWDHQNKVLTLSGARITVTEPVRINNEYYGIFLPNDTIEIVLKEGTESLVQVCDATGEDIGGTVFSSAGVGNRESYEGQLTIRGSGKLIAKGGALDNSNNLKQGQRTSAGIYCFAKKLVIKENAVIEAYGGESRSSFRSAHSAGIIGNMVTIADNANITARGGDVCAAESRTSYGMRPFNSLSIGDNAVVRCYGGNVTKQGDSATEYSYSGGIRTSEISLSSYARVYAFGGKSINQAANSAGIYLYHSDLSKPLVANVSDNSFLHAEGGMSEENNFGIAVYRYNVPESTEQTLTVSGNAYIKAIGKESRDDDICKCKGLDFKNIHINGGTVVASAETTASKGSIEAISQVPTYADGLTLTVTAGESEGKAASANATAPETYKKRWVKIQTSEPVYAIAATPSELDFGTVKTGYTQPAAKTVTLKNTGNETVSVTGIQSAENSNYIITGNLPAEIGPRETADFTVQPKEALAEGTYNEKVTILGSNDTKSELQLKFSVIKNSSGGGYIPPVQKPDIQAGEGVKVTISADGQTATITIEEGYELDDVVLNGTSKGKVTEVKDLRTGDKLVVTAKKKDSEADDAELDKKVKELISGLEFKARSQKLKNGNIRVKLQGQFDEIKKLEKLGYTVKYKFYRSTKKSSGYKATVTKNVPLYINTAGRDGVMYYYKANIMIYDKDGEMIAQTAIKQCKYANRRWSK